MSGSIAQPWARTPPGLTVMPSSEPNGFTPYSGEGDAVMRSGPVAYVRAWSVPCFSRTYTHTSPDGSGFGAQWNVLKPWVTFRSDAICVPPNVPRVGLV